MTSQFGILGPQYYSPVCRMPLVSQAVQQNVELSQMMFSKGT